MHFVLFHMRSMVAPLFVFFFFFFNDTATTEIYTLSLHDALPISGGPRGGGRGARGGRDLRRARHGRGGGRTGRVRPAHGTVLLVGGPEVRPLVRRRPPHARRDHGTARPERVVFRRRGDHQAAARQRRDHPRHRALPGGGHPLRADRLRRPHVGEP